MVQCVTTGGNLSRLVTASSLVASVGNRDQWKNNGSAGLNGNAIEIATARTDEGLWKSQGL